MSVTTAIATATAMATATARDDGDGATTRSRDGARRFRPRVWYSRATVTDDLRALTPARPRGEPCTIDFEGSPVRAFVGEPVAVALFAAGVRTLGRSTKFHRPRGAFCLEGHCASCFLRIDGNPNLRSCLAPARPGLRCERQNFVLSADVDLLAAADWMFPGGMDHHTLMTGNRVANRLLVSVVRQMGGSGTLPDAPAPPPRDDGELASVDVCVVGGGPAGLTAAAAIARRAPRARVLLVDDQLELGGSWAAEPDGAAAATAAIADARAAGVRLVSSAVAIGFFAEDVVEPPRVEPRHADDPDRGGDIVVGTLAVSTPGGLIRVAARRILYATGAYDQNLPFLDNDRPGVISARACGRLAFRFGVRPGRRVAIVGDSPYGDRLAAGLTAAGLRADHVRRIDPARVQPVATRGATTLRGLLVESRGGGAGDDPPRPEPALAVAVAADVVAVAAMPAPASELPRQHGADVPLDVERGGFAARVDDRFRIGGSGGGRVFACGDVTGYVGPLRAAHAGSTAAAAILQTLEPP